MKKILTTKLALIILALIAMMLFGCGGEEIEENLAENSATDILGAMKIPEAVAMAPQAPGVGVPSVISVGYFKDWRRTKPITEAQAGDLVYVQVTFSEAMQVTPADDKTARPVIFFKEDKQLTRFHVAAKGSKGTDFAPGDIKPVKTASTFLGKYKVHEGVEQFTVAVGKQTTDLQGTPLSSFYTHKERLRIRQPDTTPPRVVSVRYYADAALTESITMARPGDTIYTKIVFSEEMQVAQGDRQNLPVLYHKIFHVRTEQGQYRIVEGALQNGDAMTRDGITFVGKNTLPANIVGTFWVKVDKKSKDAAGNPMLFSHTGNTLLVHTKQQPKSQTVDDSVHLQKAIAVARRIYERDQKIGDLFYDGKISLEQYYDRLDVILAEETGLSYYNQRFQDAFLAKIYREELPEYKLTIILGQYSRRGFTVEWMRLHFMHPKKTKEGLLPLFRQSVREGKVSIARGQFW